MEVFQIPVSALQLDSSGDSSLSSPTDSSEQEAKAIERPAKRYSSRGRKRLQGECQRGYSPEEEEDKKRRRAKKERTRVSNLALAYQRLARTLGLLPLRGSQKRITHEQILQGANKLISQLQQEVDCLRLTTTGNAIPQVGSNAPVYTPSKHYTISSSGDVVVVEENESITEQLDHLDHLDLSCDETLALPESDGSADIPINMHMANQTPPGPLLNFELMSPTNGQTSVTDINIQQLLNAGTTGESLVTSSSMASLPTLRHGLLLGSPPLMSLCTHIPTSSYQAYVSPIDVGAYEEIINEDICTPSSISLMSGSMAS